MYRAGQEHLRQLQRRESSPISPIAVRPGETAMAVLVLPVPLGSHRPDMIIGNAEYVSADDSQPWLVGEDENGDWWVPYRMCDVPQRGRWKPGRWRRFNRRCLLDWLHYWNSRRRNQVVFLFGSTPNSVPREDRHGS